MSCDFAKRGDRTTYFKTHKEILPFKTTLRENNVRNSAPWRTGGESNLKSLGDKKYFRKL
jgi:hypothetical protein